MIEKIILKNFGKFSGETFELAPVTVFRGDNESGKTTIFDAIFDKVCLSERRGAVWTRLKNRYGAKREAELIYKKGAEPYDIPALEFLGIFGVRAGEIHLEADDSRSWADLAKNSLFSGGLDPARLAKELSRRNDYTGNVGHNNEIKDLHAELEQAEKRLAELELAREQVLGSGREIERLVISLAAVEAKLEVKTAEVKQAQAEVKALDAALEKAGAQEELEFLEKQLALEEKLAGLSVYTEDKLRDYDALKKTADKLEKELDSLKGAQKALADQIAAAENDLARHEARREPARRAAETASTLLGRITATGHVGASGAANLPLRYILWSAGLAAAGAAWYLLRGNPGPASIIALAIIAVMGAAGYFLSVRGGSGGDKALLAVIMDEWRNAGLRPEVIARETLVGVQEALIQVKTEANGITQEAESLKARRDDMAADLRAEEAKIGGLARERDEAAGTAASWLLKAGCPTRDAYHSHVVEALSCGKDNAAMKAKVAVLMESRQATDIGNLKIKLRLLIDEQGSRSGQTKADKKALEAARAGLETLVKAKDRLGADKAAQEASLEGLRGQAAGGLKGLPENIRAERERMASLNGKIAANRLEGEASAIAAGIFAEMAEGSTLALAELAGEIRATLENVLGATDVEISGLYMECVKVRDAGGALRPTSNISSGTLDCFMLAARLAIARKTCRDKPGLLVLDEPFCAIDASRLSAALKLLKDFHSQTGWQIILLTKDPALSAQMAVLFPKESGKFIVCELN